MAQTVDETETLPVSTLDLADFGNRLEMCIRDEGVSLNNLFRAVILANDDNRSIRLHVLKADGNGRPQVGQLVRCLCAKILDYCFPRKQITQAFEHFNATGSTSRIGALHLEAQKMFTDISNTGEGGELLLFILTESILGYPQALSKMAIKTSSKMHYHGLDGVYVSCKGKPPSLRLHFGESKLHKSPTGSLKEATNSIADMLKDEGFLDSARRDYYLLNTQVDLGDEDLDDALKGFLDPMDCRFFSPEICAVLLSGHELEDYPVVTNDEPLPEQVTKESKRLISVLEKNATKREIDNFHIDLFLVPFPNIQSFRDSLLMELGLKND